jgi:hypothetical protein
MKFQMQLENYFYDCAVQDGEKAVVLIQNGIMDVKALVERDMWDGVLGENNWHELELKEQRYDVVIHMQSSAIGVPDLFPSQDSEIIRAAIQRDTMIRDAWVGHPKLKIIKNDPSFTFEEKIKAGFTHVCAEIGEKTNIKYFKKFLLSIDGDTVKELSDVFPEGLKYQTTEIEECFLQAERRDTSQIRLTKRVPPLQF